MYDSRRTECPGVGRWINSNGTEDKRKNVHQSVSPKRRFAASTDGVVGVSVYEGLIQVAFSNEKSTGISGRWGKVV